MVQIGSRTGPDCSRRRAGSSGPGPSIREGRRARVEARAALEQAEELRRVLEELGESLEDEA